jgi:hypothetical protein
MEYWLSSILQLDKQHVVKAAPQDNILTPISQIYASLVAPIVHNVKLHQAFVLHVLMGIICTEAPAFQHAYPEPMAILLLGLATAAIMLVSHALIMA